MNIQIGRFTLENDSTQFILYENRQKEAFRGKQPKEGETIKEVVGYYSQFEMSLRAIPTKAMLRSDANCLAEAIDEIKQYRKLIESFAKGV